MLGFLWLGACVVGFFWHSDCMDKAERARRKNRWERHYDHLDNSGWACLALVALWLFIWQLPYGILPPTTSWFEGSGYPY